MCFKQQSKSYWIPFWLGVAIFGWSALFVWQGLDFTDMGFLLVTYQQFYSAPETNVYFLINWLTAFLGHWIGEPLGGSVIVYKLGASAILALTGIITYLGLSAALGRRWMLGVFIFVTFLFATKASGNWISYNNLTGLFYAVGGVLLFIGLRGERRAWLLLAGAILGANLFVRFPNVLGIGLVLAVVLNGLLQHWGPRKTLKWSAGFLLGWALGVAGIAFLIIAHGHFDYYLQSLSGIFGRSRDQGSTHSAAMLLNLFVRDHLYALVLASLVIAGGVVVLRVTIERRRFLRIALLATTVVVLAVAFKSYESWRWAVPGLLYFGLVWIAWKERNDRSDLILLVFIALTILIIAPLGSNNGMRNAIYGYWLPLPLVLTWLSQRSARCLHAMPGVSSARAGTLAASILAMTLVMSGVTTAWFHSYRDSPNRLALIHPVEHPLLHGVFTTEARARVVSELLIELRKWIRPGDIILAYPDLPTLHYLTKTISFTENPWPILDRARVLKNQLSDINMSQEDLPIVVRSTGVTTSATWPADSLRSERPDREAAWQVLDDFTVQQPYKEVWNNEFFEILAPNQLTEPSD